MIPQALIPMSDSTQENNKMPPSPLIKFGVPVAVAVVCVLGALTLSDQSEPLVDAPAPAPVKKELAVATPNTVGAQWNWDSVGKDRNTTQSETGKAASAEPAEVSDFPYTAEEIYLALEKIRVDDAGNLVLDEITLQSLHDALGSGHAKLTDEQDRKSTRLNSSHSQISYAVFCLKK